MSVTENEISKLISIAFSYHQNDNLDDAENIYNKILEQEPDNAEVCNLKGVLKLQQGDVISAISLIEKAVKILPNEYFYETLLQAYIRAGLYKQIVSLKKEIFEKYPNNFSLIFNLALANKKVKNIKTAIELYEKALKINPSSFTAWFNLSHLYSIEGESENAVSALKICKKIKPHDLEVDYYLSLALFRIKNYDKGLKLYESRFSRETAINLQNKIYPNIIRKDNIWNGENIEDKTVYVYYEGGLGDVIMCSRYLPILANKCKRLIFAPQKPLVPLFKENLLGVDFVVDQFVPEEKLDFDVHVPLMSLPYLLGLKGDKVFAYSEGYIRPNIKLAENFKEKYFNNDKIKVGIKWQGNSYYDHDRVIPTKYFKQLMDVDNTQYYSFQTFEGSEDVKDFKDIIDIGKDLTDFSQTAAALSNVDIVICNDTSLAHLAGAMGIPCWVVLPYEVNWRWHTDLSVCDWYDSVKLFRQHSLGDWQSVFEDLLNEMRD